MVLLQVAEVHLMDLSGNNNNTNPVGGIWM